MKLIHRPRTANWFAIPESDLVDDEYETKVQRATERGEREYRQAQERLARTEKRLVKAQAQKTGSGRKKRIAQLQALVAERRAELAEYERMMTIPVVSADKQIRLRTGLDDHLELGQYKPAPTSHVPSGPVMRTRRTEPPAEEELVNAAQVIAIITAALRQQADALRENAQHAYNGTGPYAGRIDDQLLDINLGQQLIANAFAGLADALEAGVDRQ